MADAMTDDALARALADLASQFRTPEPSLWPRVRAQLELPDARRAPVRAFAIAAVVVLVLVLAVAAIAPARRAVADLFGIGSTDVSHVDEVRPADPPRRLEPAGTEAALRHTLAAAGLGLPDRALVGAPRGWHVDPQGETTIRYDDVAFSQRAEGRVPALKRVPEQGRLMATRIGETPGYWIEGPHTRKIDGRTVTSESALLWVDDGTELRLEGDRSLAEMLAIARSVARVR